MPFDVGVYLQTAGVKRKIVQYRKGQTIFSQGDAGSFGALSAGRFRQDHCKLLGRERGYRRTAWDLETFSAKAAYQASRCAFQPQRPWRPVSALEIEKQEMIRVLHEEHEFSDRFVAHMLKRNVRIEEDLVDQLFNSSEKRLARALLLIARYGNNEKPLKIVPQVSQGTLAEMVGTTRSRVSFFMNKFRKLGFIKYNGGLQVNDSLLRVILHDD